MLLRAVGAGDSRAADRLFPVVYDELRRLAERQFAGEGAGHTLQPTALVHEAYLRLTKDAGAKWDDPAYFFACAAQAMRRILVEHARRKGRPKHGGDHVRLSLDGPGVDGVEPKDRDGVTDWPGFDEALEALRLQDARAAEVVTLRVYAGLGVAVVAQLLGVSRATVKREWAYARAWLTDRVTDHA
ncbi:MAG: ECF-type sigma factor [Phycisphaerales bacterium]